MSDPVSFTSTTPRHALPLLFAGQAQKEFFVNESFALLDALLHPFVEAETNTPPQTPVVGQCWLVGSAPSGTFAGHTGAIACWDGKAWLFASPREGMSLRVKSDGSRIRGAASWTRVAAPAAPTGGSVVDQQARDAIATVIARLSSWGAFSP